MRPFILSAALAASLSSAPLTAGSDTAKPAKSAATDPDQVVKCRKVEVTGSLVKKGKVCKTVAEWRAISENGNVLARKLVEDGTSRPGGN